MDNFANLIGGPISNIKDNLVATVESIIEFFKNVFDLFITFLTFIPQPFRNIFLVYFTIIMAILIYKIVSDKI